MLGLQSGSRQGKRARVEDRLRPTGCIPPRHLGKDGSLVFEQWAAHVSRRAIGHRKSEVETVQAQAVCA